ncbi:hypothetical protein [Brevibacterium litoralis]|uniref:hypothetical protein n=1 Tax=Brevibacterium litoralis TaxID=3138935 RepID=UPI0032EFF20E
MSTSPSDSTVTVPCPDAYDDYIAFDVTTIDGTAGVPGVYHAPTDVAGSGALPVPTRTPPHDVTGGGGAAGGDASVDLQDTVPIARFPLPGALTDEAVLSGVSMKDAVPTGSTVPAAEAPSPSPATPDDTVTSDDTLTTSDDGVEGDGGGEVRGASRADPVAAALGEDRPLEITGAFVRAWEATYVVSDMEQQVLEIDGPRTRKREYVKKKAFLRAGEWKSVATLPTLAEVPGDDVEFMTAMALWKKTPDRYRLRTLRTLDGVTVPMASALLAGVWPQRFPIMDARAVGVLHEAGVLPSRNPADTDYLVYAEVMRSLAEACRCSVRALYRALYAYGRR